MKKTYIVGKPVNYLHKNNKNRF